MSRHRDLAVLTESALRARMSRCVRNSEAGWLFYSPGGTAYHLLTDEAEAIERRGHRLIDRYNRFAREFHKLPKRLLLLAFVAFCAAIFIQAIDRDAALFVVTAAIMLSGLVYLSNPLLIMCTRNAVFLSWQAREARRLKKIGRGAVPQRVERHHRRYNLFRIAFNLALAVFVLEALYACFAPPSLLREKSLWPLGLSIGVMAITIVPARRIDATHRRRKWLE